MDVPLQGKVGRPHHPYTHAPSIIASSAASIGIFYKYGAGEIWDTPDEPHKGTFM